MMQAKKRWFALVQQRCLCRNIPGMTRKTREKEYERLVDLEKPYKKVMALKNLLLKEPENVFSFAELGKLRAHVGLTAQLLAEQEVALAKRYEAVAVQKLRKLLMMAVDQRIRVPKIAHLRRDLGLPADFQSRMIYAYPQYFKVVEEKFKNEDGPVLQLTCWDPSLAITSLETRSKSTGEHNSAGEPLFKICVSKALRLSKKQKEGIDKFQERPFISPYADSKDFNKNTIEFEKRQVALLHEILSLTLERKTVFDYLTHFRKEYRLPQSVLGMVLRHHSIFYVSRKGGRFTIFLKEAYEGGSLIQKNEWNLLKEQFMALMDSRKLKMVEEDAKAIDAAHNSNSSREELASDEQDPDFDALISLCHKIQKNSASFVADSKSKPIAETQEEGKGMPLNEDGNPIGLANKFLDESFTSIDDSSSGEGEHDEEDCELFRNTSDEDVDRALGSFCSNR
eukprot:c9865_g1_i2 orf=193-1551(-)